MIWLNPHLFQTCPMHTTILKKVFYIFEHLSCLRERLSRERAVGEGNQKKKYFIFPCVLLLSGCATLSGVGTDNSPAPTPLCAFKPLFVPEARWSAQSGVGADGHYLKLTPAIDNTQLFTVDAKGQAFAFDVVTGRAGFCKATKTAVTTGVAAKAG